MYHYPYPYAEPPPPARSKRSQKLQALAVCAGLLVLVITGVTVNVMLQRLDDTVLTVIATIGCAAGVSLPGLLLATLLLIRRAENGNGNKSTPATMTQPTIMVVPPMTLPQLQQQSQQPPPAATWEHIPIQRHYTVVGEE